MQADFDWDAAEVLESIDEADVVSIIFPHVGKCLVFDGRYAEEDPPRVAVLSPIGSAERRLDQLNQARPNLPKAIGLAAIPWIDSVSSMISSPVWEHLVARATDSGFKEILSACQAAMHELLGCEYDAKVDMIRGRGPFYTLWERLSEDI